MRDENKGDAELGLKVLQLDLHVLAELGVKGGEGFVEQENLRPTNQGAGKSDTLTLAAGELVRLAGLEAGQGNEFEGLEHPAFSFGSLHLLHFEAKFDVVAHGEVGKEGVVS